MVTVPQANLSHRPSLHERLECSLPNLDLLGYLLTLEGDDVVLLYDCVVMSTNIVPIIDRIFGVHVVSVREMDPTTAQGYVFEVTHLGIDEVGCSVDSWDNVELQIRRNLAVICFLLGRSCAFVMLR